jgi:hypothetical protein
MKLSDIDPKKRYNIFLEQPHKGLGDPGQLGIYDISGEKLIEAVKSGARVERVSGAKFQLGGIRTSGKGEEKRLAKERNKRRSRGRR